MKIRDDLGSRHRQERMFVVFVFPVSLGFQGFLQLIIFFLKSIKDDLVGIKFCLPYSILNFRSCETFQVRAR